MVRVIIITIETAQRLFTRIGPWSSCRTTDTVDTTVSKVFTDTVELAIRPTVPTEV